MLYGPRLLISPVGGSVTIKCYYLATTANRHDRKYLCKESKFSHKRCQTVISTNHFIYEEYKGRVSMEDSPHNGILKVTMTELEKKDSSNYRCGIGRNNNGLYAGVNLTVWEGANLPKSPKIIWGKLRGSVMIQCSLETTTQSMRSSLCKISKSGCIPIVGKNRHKQQDGRIIFTMEDSPGMFNVIINELRTQDSGIYQCGMGTLDDIAKMMQLQVVEGQPSLAADNEIHAVAGSPLTVSCSYPCKYADYEKYWCKWKNTGCDPIVSVEQKSTGFAVSCNKGSRILTLKFDQTSLADQGWYWCGVRHGGHYGETYAIYLQVRGVLQNSGDVRNNPKNRGSSLNEAKEAAGVGSSAE
ncbi:hypothetical protein JRQ81_013914, partial [Phrynocephalus forsythii]